MVVNIPTCRRSGVYKIVNVVTGKVYVGSTAAGGFRSRAMSHRQELERGDHGNIILQRSWNKHGGDAFKFMMLQVCEPEDCVKVEQEWLDKLKAADRKHGYNLCPTAGNRLGTKQSDAAKAKISAFFSGRPSGRLGQPCPEEVKAKLREANLGKKHGEAAKIKCSEGHWKHGPKAAEIRKILSMAGRGRRHSDATKQSLKEIRGEYWSTLTDEERVKFSEAVKASHWSNRPDAAEIDARRRATRERKRLEAFAKFSQRSLFDD